MYELENGRFPDFPLAPCPAGCKNMALCESIEAFFHPHHLK
jgi:hypothetical protein